MASIMDMLLGAETSKLIERQSAIMKVTRLAEQLGFPFELELVGLTSRELDNLPAEDRPVYTILKGVKNIDFSNQALAEKFKSDGRQTPLTPPEVVRALFLPGEINGIASAIFDLSGFGSKALEKIEKN